MCVVNGMAYAEGLVSGIDVEAVTALDDMMLLLTFSTGEKRLYDATALLEYPAFQPLRSEDVFKAVTVESGIVVWLDGEIDIATEALYKDSYAYQDAVMPLPN